MWFQSVTNLKKNIPIYLLKKICIQVDPCSSNPCYSGINCIDIERGKASSYRGWNWSLKPLKLIMEPKMEARSSHHSLYFCDNRILYLLITTMYYAWKLWVLFSVPITIFSKLYHLPITFHTNISPKIWLLRVRAHWNPI